jgi:hypothetical protein
MKKTVQIVTVFLNEVSKIATNDRTGKYELAKNETIFDNDTEYTPQQLLVLSNDEIQEGDWCTLLDSFGNVVMGNPAQYFPNLGHTLNKGLRKTIASYPNIDGTLPLSKETIQQWIDNGTPEEGFVDIGKFYTGNYIGKCKTCNKVYVGDKRWYWCKECSEKQLVTDSQGNLILEFVETFSIPECKSAITVASVVPTDKEIAQIAEMFVDETEMQSSFCSKTTDEIADYNYYFVLGYKQALKDLGYDN